MVRHARYVTLQLAEVGTSSWRLRGPALRLSKGQMKNTGFDVHAIFWYSGIRYGCSSS